MKKYLLLLSLILASCKSISYGDVNPVIAKNNILLPPLESVTDIYNLESTYSAGGFSAVSDNIGGMGGGNNFGGWMQTTDTSGINYKDSRVNDAINIFEKEVVENITNPYGEKKGYIVLKLGYIEEDNSFIYPAVSLCTLYTINLFGFPQNKISQLLEVEVDILDNNKNLVKRYVETVNNSDYVAMWWGYDESTIYRKIAADNIKEALSKIRIKIGQDALEIRSKLQ